MSEVISEQARQEELRRFIDSLPTPLWRNDPAGQFVQQLMQSPMGDQLRTMYPKLEPVCVEFPHHMVILSDLSVTTCCGDALGENVFGSLVDKSYGDFVREDMQQLLDKGLYSLPRCVNCVGSRKASLTTREAERIEYRDRYSKIPPELTIEVMGACNYACCQAAEVHNYRGVKPDLDLLFERLRDSLGEIERLRLFNYGEPLLHDGFPKFLSQVREAAPNIRMTIATNGMLMDEAWAEVFLETEVTDIVVSVHGGPGTENMLRYSKRNADYDKVVANVERLLTLRRERYLEYPKVGFRAILFRWNDDDETMDWFRRDAARLGLNATSGDWRTDNYHWIPCGGDICKTIGSQTYRRGSEGFKRLRAAGELML